MASAATAGRPSSTPARPRAAHHAPGSCSLRGGDTAGWGARAEAWSRPVVASRSSSLVAWVELSTPRTSATDAGRGPAALADAQQQLGHELVEALVPVALAAERVLVVARHVGAQPGDALGCRSAGQCRLAQPVGLRGSERILDLGVLGEAAGLVPQDEVGAHAAPGEVPHAVGVLGAVGVGVEVPHPVPAGLLQQLRQVEGVANPLAAEAEVLVELADALGVEVDVEELAVPEALAHRVVERQPRHRLV